MTSQATPRLANAHAFTAVLGNYLALTKPAIIVLLLLTALGGMFLAAKGPPPPLLALAVMIGGTLAAAGANALNHYLDRDIDEVMMRTRGRPVPGRRVSPYHALAFGIALNVVAFGLLAAWVNLLSAALSVSATLFYVFVYTLWLKRSTPQNIVIGGAAGAVPPLVGWAAITGGLALPAFYLFAIIFFWTPPHFWALSLMITRDYARAGVPMLPVVIGVEETKRAILLYSALLVALTLMFFTIQSVGWLYLASAAILGAIFIYLSFRLLRGHGVQGARRLYLFSLLYLALLFTAIMVDSSLRL